VAPDECMKAQTLRVGGALVGGFVVIFAALFAIQKLSAPAPAPADLPMFWPQPKRIEPFSLTDQHGTEFGLERVTGRWSLWYFGYTFCPDVCPVTLTVMNGVHETLAASVDFSGTLQSVFVSIDPARDTSERLSKYVSFFNPGFVAATASSDSLSRLTLQLGINFAPQTPDEQGNYVVDHTAAILLTDPQARLVAWFGSPHTAAQISAQMIRIAQFVDGAK
jgi:protein SCO1/2